MIKSEVDEIVSRIDQRQMLVDTEPGRKRSPNQARQELLSFLQRRRQSGARPAVLPTDEGTIGYAALMIPELDFFVLQQRFPDLASKDAQIRTRAWQKFMRGPLSEIYRVDAGVGRRRPNHKIIVR